MEYKRMGKSGLKVSELAFGTMSFGDTLDEEGAKKIFHRCRDLGINHYDCADVYAGGGAEEILGGLMKGCRDEIVVATKGYFPTSKHPNGRGNTRYHLVRAVEDSLRRLDTDRIDIYYLHRFDDHTPLEETLRTLDDLVQAGKILYLGASNFAAWQLAHAVGVARLHSWEPLVCLQPMYNLVKRQAEVELLPYAQYERLAVFPYNPLAAGLLTGKYSKEKPPQMGRLLENQMYATRYGAPGYADTAQRFAALAQELGHPPAALAMAWVASHPAVTSPIVGVRSLEHLEVAVSSLSIEMTPELRANLSALSPTPPPATDRTEEGSAHNFTAVTQSTAKG